MSNFSYVSTNFLQLCHRIKTGFMKMFREVGKSRVLVQLRRETHQNDRPGPYFSKIRKSTRYFANSAGSGRKCESSITGRISGRSGFGALKNFLEVPEGQINRFGKKELRNFRYLGRFWDFGGSRFWIFQNMDFGRK